MPLGTAAATPQQISPVFIAPGWAGYIVRAGGKEFTEIRGTWIEPRTVCNRPQSSVAFWVGIGGAERDSGALEQIGTSVDCSGNALPTHSAWYQLFPQPPVDLSIEIRPGDIVSATLSVRGKTVALALTDNSSGASFSTSVTASTVESGSAEWIAEAPAACLMTECVPLHLADFGRVVFSDASATAGLVHGTIVDTAWTTQPVWMAPHGLKVLMVPTRVRRNGTAFSVRTLGKSPH